MHRRIVEDTINYLYLAYGLKNAAKSKEVLQTLKAQTEMIKEAAATFTVCLSIVKHFPLLLETKERITTCKTVG